MRDTSHQAIPVQCFRACAYAGIRIEPWAAWDPRHNPDIKKSRVLPRDFLHISGPVLFPVSWCRPSQPAGRSVLVELFVLEVVLLGKRSEAFVFTEHLVQLCKESCLHNAPPGSPPCCQTSAASTCFTTLRHMPIF